jgi:hypothetical protein
MYRKSTDPLYELRKDIGRLIAKSMYNNGYSTKSKANVILGCSFSEFKLHLEKQFLPEMGWDNRNKWHLDHIIPISLANSDTEIILLNHYTNFRPLWAKDNITKGNKLIEDAINHPLYQKLMDLRK